LTRNRGMKSELESRIQVQYLRLRVYIGGVTFDDELRWGRNSVQIRIRIRTGPENKITDFKRTC